MSVNCQQVAEQAGNGVAAALRAVDCTAGNITAEAFGRLFAPGGQMATVLTILLTIYIAIFGLMLLTGRTNVGVRALVPRAITIQEAAAPDSSLLFMLIGALILLPIIIGYTAFTYWIFRGKVDPDAGYH